MPKDKVFEVKAQEDFVEKLAAARPAQALAELIWNGLDAEATKVAVEADRNAFGLEAIRVLDDGHGIPPEDAQELFGHLGGSWKRTARQSKNGKRVLHGEEGRGRFRALALGRVAEWTITAFDSKKRRVRYRVTLIKDRAREFRISPPVEVDDDCRIGTEVKVSELYKQFELDGPGLLQELTEIYALYLTEYPAVRISVLGNRLDPTRVIESRETLPLAAILVDGESHPADLEIIEWKRPTERMLYLCSEDGFPLHRISPGIQAPGFDFSAYLRSAYISRLHESGSLDLAELDSRLLPAVENAKNTLRDHFKKRQGEKHRTLVEEWKNEQVYPYSEDPVTPVQHVERQVFDIVAVSVADCLKDFQTQDQRNRRFQLRMLREVIERSPDHIQLIIGEVLGLSQRSRKNWQSS
jgi:hypothetical protein